MILGTVIFRCDAGAEDGLGHLMRCLTLADAIKKLCDSTILFISYDPDGSTEERVSKRGFGFKRAIELAGSTADLDFLLKSINITDTGWVVLDSKRIDADYVLACRQKSHVLCFDDDQYRDLPCDLLVNNHIGVTEQCYQKNIDRQLLIGPRYNTIQDSFFEIGKNKHGSNKHVLITLGGEDPHDHTSWLLEHLSLVLSDFPVVVVVGPAHPRPQHVEEMALRWLPHAKLITLAQDLSIYMRDALLVLTAGGTTCYEIAAARVAQAVVIVEEHQQALVMPLVEAGAVFLLGRFDNLKPDKVVKQVKILLNDHKVASKLVTNAAKLFKCSGAPNIVRAMCEK